MERLTERNKNGLAMAACCEKECEYNFVCEVGGFGECRGMDDIIDRLADIEDILGDTYDLDRLRELVKADRDGRIKIIPEYVGKACGSCGHFQRIAGTRRGKCEVKRYATSRRGTPWPDFPFEPSQSRTACKQWVGKEIEHEE